MIKIKKKRLENLMGNRLLAPLKEKLRLFAQTGRRRRLKEIFASTYSEPTPFFHQVQVETCSFCNNDCHFCPASTAVDPRAKKFMDWDIIRVLVEQLKSIEFNGLVSLFNNNDPLIDRRLPEIIAFFKAELPAAKIEIYTNGILLNMDVAAELWDAGLDSLMIDHYYTRTERNRKIEKFIDDFRGSSYAKKHNVTINEINKEIIRSSRGGEAPNKKEATAVGFCSYPFMQLNVNYRGDIHLCCNDVYYQEVFGNINKSHIRDIWNSPAYQAKRRKLLDDDRNTGICTNCDTCPIFKGATEIAHQTHNNQVIIPAYINNGERVEVREPATVYSLN